MATVSRPRPPARLFQVRIDGKAREHFSSEECAQLFVSTFNRHTRLHGKVAVAVELDPDSFSPVGSPSTPKPRYRILIVRDGRVLKQCKAKKGMRLKRAVGTARAMNLCLTKRDAMAIVAPMPYRVEGGAA